MKTGSLITKYTYDKIGRLTRVNDQTDTTAGTNGTTWVFTYDLGGNILTKESLGKRSFARPMSKRDSGVYVKVRMELDPSKVDELVNRYALVEEVFRVQILAVDERREAKIAAERAARAERQAKKEAAAAAAAAQAAEA